MLHFQKLDVYRCSIEFLSLSRSVLRGLRRGNADLVDQLRRSSRSILQNIGEGAGKVSQPDKAKYYAIARGSAMESATHLDIMREDGLISEELYVRGTDLLERIAAMLTKMIDP